MNWVGCDLTGNARTPRPPVARIDGTTWQVAFTGALGGAAMDAVLEHPLDARLRFDLAAAPARFVRLRLLKSDPIYQWAVADVIVRGAP